MELLLLQRVDYSAIGMQRSVLRQTRIRVSVDLMWIVVLMSVIRLCHMNVVVPAGRRGMFYRQEAPNRDIRVLLKGRSFEIVLQTIVPRLKLLIILYAFIPKLHFQILLHAQLQLQGRFVLYMLLLVNSLFPQSP